jgi:hypothetical protein
MVIISGMRLKMVDRFEYTERNSLGVLESFSILFVMVAEITHVCIKLITVHQKKMSFTVQFLKINYISYTPCHILITENYFKLL